MQAPTNSNINKIYNHDKCCASSILLGIKWDGYLPLHHYIVALLFKLELYL